MIQKQIIEVGRKKINTRTNRYRVSENEGQTEKGCETLKIGGFDHLFGISVIYT